MKNIIIFCLLLSHNILFAQYEPPKKLDIDFDIGMIAESGLLFLDKTA